MRIYIHSSWLSRINLQSHRPFPSPINCQKFSIKKWEKKVFVWSCRPVIVKLFLICIHISLGACYPIDSYFPFKSQLWITETIFSSLFFHSFFKLNWYWKRIDFPYFYVFSELNYICLRNLENSIRQNLLGRLGKLCVGAWEVWI